MKGPFERRGVRWWVADGLEIASALRAAEAAVERVRSGELTNRKDGRRKALYETREAEGPGYLLKANEYVGAARWRRRLTGSKARHELRGAEAASARQIATPVPIAAGEELRAGRLERCWILVPRLEGVVDLRAGIRDGALDGDQRRALAGPFGAFAASLHAAGIDQDDFSPNNFLVRSADPAELFMIDFERVRLGRPLPTARRAENLAKLSRELTRASDVERLRFLRGYAPGEESLWWARVAHAVRRRAGDDTVRLRRTCLGDGRRFARIRGEGWSGHRRGPDPGPPRRADLARAAGGPEIMDGVVYVPLGSEGRPEHWVVANLLYLRELAPRPVAFWQRAEGACIAYAPASELRVREAPTDARERAALRILERHVASIAALPGTAAPLAFGHGPRGELRALWLDPRGVRPGSGRAAGSTGQTGATGPAAPTGP